MKSIPKLLLLMLTGQLFFGMAAQAATAPALSAPSNSFVYVELNTAKDHPLKGQLANFFSQLAGSADTSLQQELLQKLSEDVENTTVSYSQSYHTDGSEIHFLSMAMSQESFQVILDTMGTDLVKKDLGQGKIIYRNETDFFFTYKDGNLLASSREGIISDLLIQSQITSLQSNPDWQYLQSKSSPESFLKMFINFNNIPDSALTGENISKSDLTSLVQSEGLSLQQTLNGFTGLVTVKTGTGLIKDPATFSFLPELHRSVNSSGILFYAESFDWADSLKENLDIMNNLNGTDTTGLSASEIYNQIAQALTDYTGLNPDTDIAPLFKNRSALAVNAEPTRQMMPAFTLITEVPGLEYKARETLSKARGKIITSMEESFNSMYDEEQRYRDEMAKFYADDPAYQPAPLPSRADLKKMFFTTSTATVNGVTFDQMNIDLNASSYFYTDKYTTDPKQVLTLSTAVNSKGQMIITTTKDLGTLFPTNGGLSGDSEWQKNFVYEKSISISFLNFLNLASYIKEMAMDNGATAEDIQPVMDFLSPLKSVYSSSKYDSGYYLGTFKLNIDLSQISKITSVLEELGRSFSSSFSEDSLSRLDMNNVLDPGMFLSFGFNDVPEDAWYARYVNHMANLDIMKGYGDEFRPNQNITRAEFVKTLISAYEAAGNYSIQTEPDRYYGDVSPDAWYAPYVNKARAMSFANGYTDNTFRPNQNITRAEAMVMLINMRNSYNNQYTLKDLPFTDVVPGSWYYDAVRKAFSLKYATGKTLTTFAPNDNLTRAETATIISRYLESN
jgi:hypothetical protein